MLIFWRLILAHLLTDFTFQTNRLAKWKRKSIFGVFIHSLIFLFLSLVLTWPYLMKTWWKLPGWACIILVFVVHFFEDQYRVLSVRKSGSSDNILFFLWDQFIHIILIFLLSPFIEMYIAEKLIVILILIVLVTHFTNVIVYYLEQAVYGDRHSLPPLESSIASYGDKYYPMVKRLLVFGCLLLPGWWWISFPVVWLLGTKLIKAKFGWNLLLSDIFCLVCGILGRLVFYD